MKKEDIDKSRAAVAGALGTLNPLIASLQQAGSVLDILVNAEKHKAALQAEVEALGTEVVTHKTRLDKLKKQVAAAEAEADVQVQLAGKRVEAAKADADVAIAEIQKALKDQVAAAQQAAAQKQNSFTAAITDAQKAHDATMADLFGKEKEASDAATAAEKKLKKIQDSAAQFAAQLAGG